MKSHLLCAILISSISYAFGQVNPNNDRQVVLRSNKVGHVYTFDRSKNENYNKTELTYLGKIKTRDGRIFKILISRWFWGLSPRATSRILVYNSRNQYLGNYSVTMTYDLPTRIDNKALVFENKDRETCYPKIVTRISLYNGLPKQFFLECKDKMGDIYSFGDE